MKIEEDSEAQEALHSANQGTEPSLIPFNGIRAPHRPSRTKSPRSAANRTPSHPIATIGILSHSTVIIGTHSIPIAPNQTQLHLPSKAISLHDVLKFCTILAQPITQS